MSDTQIRKRIDGKYEQRLGGKFMADALANNGNIPWPLSDGP